MSRAQAFEFWPKSAILETNLGILEGLVLEKLRDYSIVSNYRRKGKIIEEKAKLATGMGSKEQNVKVVIESVEGYMHTQKSV